MILKNTNIHKKLLQTKQKDESKQKKLLEEVQQILQDTKAQHLRIDSNLARSENHYNDFDFDSMAMDRVFHISHIRTICIDYRLRFLDSSLFKGEIPPEAIAEIRELEKVHDTELKGFKIIAPSKLFKLKDKDDPLLFAPMGNDYYYLIHQWGTDLHPLRKLLMWPFKSIVNLVLIVLAISYFVTLLVPEGLFSKQSSRAEFWLMFFFMFKCIASIVIFYGFALGKNFSPQIWRSKYFNA
ncbi:MAG: hypothetical protein WBM83_12000 [Flavobacteriaceae bacterium]